MIADKVRCKVNEFSLGSIVIILPPLLSLVPSCVFFFSPVSLVFLYISRIFLGYLSSGSQCKYTWNKINPTMLSITSWLIESMILFLERKLN